MQNRTIWACISVAVLLYGCAMAEKRYPLRENGVKVIGEKIYLNEKPFAEVRYFDDKRHNLHIGLSIYYYPSDKEVWIFPKEGWSVRLAGKEYFSALDVDLIWNNNIAEHLKWIAGKREALELNEEAILLLGGDNPPKLRPTVYDVKISEDGKYVSYKTPAPLFESHKYLVEYDVLK